MILLCYFGLHRLWHDSYCCFHKCKYRQLFRHCHCLRGRKCLLLDGRHKRNAGEKEAAAREEASPLGRRSCSARWTTGRREGSAMHSSCLSLITKWEHLSILIPDCLIIYFAHFKEGEHHLISFWTNWKSTLPLFFFSFFSFFSPARPMLKNRTALIWVRD